VPRTRARSREGPMVTRGQSPLPSPTATAA
jgi:hypothetical protein